MNYFKRSLALLLITGFSLTNTQPLIAFTVNADAITPVIEIIKENKQALNLAFLTVINALGTKFAIEKADEEARKSYHMTQAQFLYSLAALTFFTGTAVTFFGLELEIMRS